MGEIKSVKVDNWGVFFLQKLQNFFNKTDYCDLTLQFRDNSQLKVHRLVLSACTDYFNVLEQTCEIVDDALIMPNELQADVVVPIVNFMYTGTLEFELKMYGKLLRTAKEMNMTVLLKLLEAHRRTMENVSRTALTGPSSPKTIRRRGPQPPNAVAQPQTVAQQSQTQRRVLAAPNVSSQRRIVTTKPGTVGAILPYRQQIGSTSVIRTTSNASNQQQQPIRSFEIKREAEEQQSASTFEQLRKGYNNNKRPSLSTFASPPTKKPNIEDVKEFAEQQRMRKQIAAEYGEDQEYEGMLDDDIHNDDDDDDAAAMSTSAAANTNSQIIQDDKNSATITIKTEQPDKPPTILVKDSPTSKMNHAKIISEVLRQYPHLIKNSKGIKLKILSNNSGQTQKIILKKEGTGGSNDNIPRTGIVAPQAYVPPEKPVTIQRTLPQKPIVVAPASTQKLPSTSAIAVASTSTSTMATDANSLPKRRIDSKTMHSLIALGAENTKGPWLCLRCGVNGRPISIPTYRGFRRHLVNIHRENIDPALCEHCGWRSTNNRELHFHIEIDHKIKSNLYTFPACLMCTLLFINTNALNQHMVESHPEENKQQCIYCNKIFAKELQLFTHMKTYHKKQALGDGIIDYSEDEYQGGDDDDDDENENENENENEHEEELEENLESQIDKNDGQIKILSDICFTTSTTTKPVSISETKFINADGNEMILTDEQRQEIISQLNQEHDGNTGGVVMLLDDNAQQYKEPKASEENEAQEGNEEDVENEEDEENVEQEQEQEQEQEGEDDYDDSEIYNELAGHRNAVEENQKVEVKKSTNRTAATATASTSNTNLEESKESLENLEWAENLISEHELADKNNANTVKKDKTKQDDEISQKLKELTGDWSEDENDNNDDADEDDDDDDEHETGDNAADTADMLEQTLADEQDDDDDNDDIDGEDDDDAVDMLTECLNDEESRETKSTKTTTSTINNKKEIVEVEKNKEVAKTPKTQTLQREVRTRSTTKVIRGKITQNKNKDVAARTIQSFFRQHCSPKKGNIEENEKDNEVPTSTAKNLETKFSESTKTDKATEKIELKKEITTEKTDEKKKVQVDDKTDNKTKNIKDDEEMNVDDHDNGDSNEVDNEKVQMRKEKSPTKFMKEIEGAATTAIIESNTQKDITLEDLISETDEDDVLTEFLDEEPDKLLETTSQNENIDEAVIDDEVKNNEAEQQKDEKSTNDNAITTTTIITKAIDKKSKKNDDDDGMTVDEIDEEEQRIATATTTADDKVQTLVSEWDDDDDDDDDGGGGEEHIEDDADLSEAIS